MPQLYDYEKYYKPMTATAKVKIDLSGLPLKTLASLQDEDGETTLNECVTNNVIYYLERVDIVTASNKKLTMTRKNAYEFALRIDVGDNIKVFTTPGHRIDELLANEVIKPQKTQYKRPPDTLTAGKTLYSETGDSLGEISLTLEKFEKDKAVPTVTRLSTVTLSYIPRYAMMKAPDADGQSQNFRWMNELGDYRRSLGVLGFDRMREHTKRWFDKYSNKKARAVVGYDSFQKTLKYINEFINASGMGLEVTYYDDKFKDLRGLDEMLPTDEDSRNVRRSKMRAYVKESNKREYGYTATEPYGGWPNMRYTGETMYEKFIEWKNEVNRIHADLTATRDERGNVVVDGTPLINSIAGLEESANGTGTALIPNVCDAFKAFYYSKDELSQGFIDAFSDLYDCLEAWGNFHSEDSYKKDIAPMMKALDVSSFDPSTCNIYAIDLAEVYRSLWTVAAKGLTWYEDKGYKHNEIVMRVRGLSIGGSNVYYTTYTSDMITDENRHINRVAGPKKLVDSTGKFVASSTYSASDFFTNYPSSAYGKLTNKTTASEFYYQRRKTVSKKASDIYVELRDEYNKWYAEFSNIACDSTVLMWVRLDDFNATVDQYSDAVGGETALATFKELVAGTTTEYGSSTKYTAGVITCRRCKIRDGLLTKTVYYASWYAGGFYYTFDLATPSRYEKHSYGATMLKYNFDDYCAIDDSPVYSAAQFLTEAGMQLNALRAAMQTGTKVPDSTMKPGTKNDDWVMTGEYSCLEFGDDLPWPSGNYTKYDYYQANVPSQIIDPDLSEGDVSMRNFEEHVLGALSRCLCKWGIALAKSSNNTGDENNAGEELEAYSDAREAYSTLKDYADKIRYYEYITHESVFYNLSRLTNNDNGVSTDFKQIPARFMIPVLMYKKVKKRYKRFGFTRHKMVKKSIGVRWTEVRLIDTTVYGEYPQLPDDTYTIYKVNQTATISGTEQDGYVVSIKKAVEGSGDIGYGDISGQQYVMVDLMNSDGYVYAYEAMPNGDMEYDITDADFDSTLFGEKCTLVNVKVPLPTSQDDDARSNVEVRYNMPALPRYSEIRHRSFVDYGPFDQSKYAIIERTGDQFKGRMGTDGHFIYDVDENGQPVPLVDRVDGWRIFHDTSMKISDMRKGMGVFDAAASLLGILRATFGEQRVELCETMRSAEDESMICSGGAESEFLSWHNYGLGIKILIYQDDLKTPLAEDSEDFLRLIDVAEAFTKAARDARVCPKPLNVVWCGRLVMGANIFCWEFLPIGVEHRDAPKFREALLARMDPVERMSYVDVDGNGYVRTSVPGTTGALAREPYVIRDTDTYRNAEIAAGRHYVDPAKVVNYLPSHIHTELPLINVIEFIKMIQLKIAANGSSLTDRANIYEWKAVNETSFRQLVTYFGMVGNLSGAASLLAGEFVERYQNIVDMYYTTDLVEFVKQMLGNLYAGAKIYITGIGDGGAYISLADGRIHVFGESTRSAYDQNYGGNVFGERQVDPTKIVRGIERDGVFYTVDEAVALGMEVEYVSDGPVISGYSIDAGGNVTIDGKDAQLLHAMVATQIREHYDALKDRFENYGGLVMYDHFSDGPNADSYNMLENEFGIIVGQTLMDFDSLRSMVYKSIVAKGSGASGDTTGGSTSVINPGGGKLLGDSYGDLDGNGMPLESVFEKVVSNAQLSGVRKASLTKEHVVEIPRSNGLSVERIYSMLTNGRKMTANDLMRRR